MITATRKAKSGFFIGVSCPGCGGDLALENNFFVLACSHCGSALRVIMPDQPPAFLVPCTRPIHEVRFLIDLYCKENELPLPSSQLFTKLLFYPYWKVDAVALKVRIASYTVATEENEYQTEQPEEEREFRSTNLTPFSSTVAAGYKSEEIPYSLGIRAEYIRMVPFARENVTADASCVPVTLPFTSASRDAARMLSGVNSLDAALDRRNQTRLFRPEGTVIYFPYILSETISSGRCRRFVSDGLTGKVVGSSNLVAAAAASSSETEEVAFGSLSVGLHRCANCGVDLPVTQSCVYTCHNCAHVAMLVENPFLSSGITIAKTPPNPSDRLIPFWSIRVAKNDAPRLTKLFSGLQELDSILIPGIRVTHVEAMFRLCCRMTTAASRLAWDPLDTMDSRFAPVTLTPAEALRMVEVIASRESMSQESLAGEFTPLQPVEISLLYAPFRAEGYFYVDSVLGAVTFEQALLE